MVKKLVFILAALGASAAYAQTSTAQSAMFNNTAAGTFVISGSSVYSFNKDVAATYFTNLLSGGPAVTCTGGGPGGVNCLPANQPAAPAASAPDASKLTNHISNNSCNFFDGAALSLSIGGPTTYTQSATIAGLNTKGNWKFEWTYTIAFATTAGPFDPLTAWNLESTNTTAADVGVDGFFAGESVQKKTKATGADKWTFKASFTILDAGISRMVNPQYTITDSTATVVCGPTAIALLPVEQGVDFQYDQNAGTNGTTSLLIPSGTVSAIQTGQVYNSLGDKDNFAGNDTTLGEKQAVDTANTPTCSISAAGSYTLNVTGTMKGVSGAASLPVSVASSVCISAGTCSVCQ